MRVAKHIVPGPLRTCARGAITDATAGEASPRYISHPLAANRIHKTVPDVKLIAVLRNATERAISHCFHRVRTKREHLPMVAASQRERSEEGARDFLVTFL